MKELSQCTILAVDDTKMNLDILVGALGSHYELCVAMNGPDALTLAANASPDLILLDIMMSGMDGFEVLRRLKENPVTSQIPVIFLTALSEAEDKAKGFELGAVDYIIKPFQLEEVYARIKTHLKLKNAQEELKIFNSELQELVAKQVEEINQSQLAMIFALAKLSHTRDDSTGFHLERVQKLCQTLATALSKEPDYAQTATPKFITTIFHASPLHDVGKVGIEDAILLKPGKLTDWEYEIMKTHTTIGAATLESVFKHYPNNEFIEMGIKIAKFHHEKWDGGGYPMGLAGEKIPLSARIMALVDVYDALRARRPYKEPFSHQVTMNIIIESAGRAFDPKLTEVFQGIHMEFDAVNSELTDGA